MRSCLSELNLMSVPRSIPNFFGAPFNKSLSISFNIAGYSLYNAIIALYYIRDIIRAAFFWKFNFAHFKIENEIITITEKIFHCVYFNV